jgi:DNA polymerase-2
MISGLLFDAYPIDNKMIFWIKQENGKNTIRQEDSGWGHSIYVVSDNNNNCVELLNSIQEEDEQLIKEYEFTFRYERIIDTKQTKTLKLTLLDSIKALTLARRIETFGKSKFGKYRIYNVDLLPAQSYFYEHDIFPLAFWSHLQLNNKLKYQSSCCCLLCFSSSKPESLFWHFPFFLY